MTVVAASGTVFEATVTDAPPNMVGTIGVQVQDGQGVATVPRTTDGIVESPAGSGFYTATLTAPLDVGQYLIVWDTGGTEPEFAVEELLVEASIADDVEVFLDGILGKAAVNDTTYTAEMKQRAIEVALTAIERRCERKFRGEVVTFTADGTGHTLLRLPCRDLLSVQAIGFRGTDQVVSLADIAVDRSGTLRLSNGDRWPEGDQAVTVTVTRGGTMPVDVARAVALLASSIIVDGPFDDRGYGVTDDAGFVRLLTAGVGGAGFSIPEVEALVRRYRVPGVS
jgi:hypothetical protein